jgi:spermidine synthase
MEIASMELWFTEQEQDHLRLGFKTSAVLFQGRSPYQTVEVLETKPYGKMLVLDGCVMVTEGDEFVYHEMIAHVPALTHESPRDVVVIGGGDGGTVRELLKHKSVQRVVLCEIDQMVIDACREFFPGLASSFDSPRVELKVGDGVAFMKEQREAFDLAVIDSTDPIGPGEGLFSGEFYRSVARALRPGGLMVAQSESPWYAPEILQRIHRNISGGFKERKSYVGSIPTYPRGLWSWTMAANQALAPGRYVDQRFDALGPLQYLTRERVRSAFELPPFYAAKINV